MHVAIAAMPSVLDAAVVKSNYVLYVDALLAALSSSSGSKSGVQQHSLCTVCAHEPFLLVLLCTMQLSLVHSFLILFLY